MSEVCLCLTQAGLLDTTPNHVIVARLWQAVLLFIVVTYLSVRYFQQHCWERAVLHTGAEGRAEAGQAA